MELKKKKIPLFEPDLQRIGKKNIIFFLLILMMGTVGAETPFLIEFNWENVQHYNKYQQDFFYLCQLLEDSHPGFYQEIPQDEFIKRRNRFAGSLELVVDRQKFALMLQKFVSQLNDAHTQIYYLNGFGEERLPVKFEWMADQLYISNVNQGMDINLIGSRVLKLGTTRAPELEKILSPCVSAENKYWRQFKLSELMNNVGFLVLTEIMSEESGVYLEIEADGKPQKIYLPSTVDLLWLKPAAHPVTARNQKFFSYELQPDLSVCYFQFNEFLDLQTAHMYYDSGLISENEYPDYHDYVQRNGGDFRIFLEKMFTAIYQNDIKNLVIDLRNNGGGNSILSNLFYDHIKLSKPIESFSTAVMLSELMQHYYPEAVSYYLNLLQNDFGLQVELPYLYDLDINLEQDFFSVIRNKDSDFYLPPSNHKFSGRMIFLTSKATFSSAGDMVTIAHDNDLGMVVGQPMGQKPTSYGDILYFTLPNSGLEGSVSHKIFKRPDRNRNARKTIIPDVLVKEDFRQKYIFGKDKVWEEVKNILAD